MKKLSYLLVLFVLSLSSCVTYNYQTTSSDEAFAKVYCKNPDYLGTNSLKVGAKTGEYRVEKVNEYDNDKPVIDTIFEKITASDLTISQLTQVTQKKLGRDITISNIRWDTETRTRFFVFTNVQRVGVTYDIIRCK